MMVEQELFQNYMFLTTFFGLQKEEKFVNFERLINTKKIKLSKNNVFFYLVTVAENRDAESGG